VNGRMLAWALPAAAFVLCAAAWRPAPPAEPGPVGHSVIIDGVARSPATVTIAQDGSTVQYRDVVLPATYELEATTQIVQVSVIAGERTRSVSCLIESADGRTLIQRSGAGAFTSVLCPANLTE
jgi:hypothetical protein